MGFFHSFCCHCSGNQELWKNNLNKKGSASRLEGTEWKTENQALKTDHGNAIYTIPNPKQGKYYSRLLVLIHNYHNNNHRQGPCCVRDCTEKSSYSKCFNLKWVQEKEKILWSVLNSGSGTLPA